MTDPLSRLRALHADGWTCRDAWNGDVLTDGLNADSLGNLDLVREYARLTGSITLRLDNFNSGANADVQRRVSLALDMAKDIGCRIDLACKPFGQKWTPGEGITPEHDLDGEHDELLGFWFRCLDRAHTLGVRPKYVLLDHAPNMDAWRAGQSDELDALIAERWRVFIAMVERTFPMTTEEVGRLEMGGGWVCENATYYKPPHIIVFGQLFGKVLPDPRVTGWLSHHGYGTDDKGKFDPVNCDKLDAARFRNLVGDQRRERLAWYFNAATPRPIANWGRAFAGNVVGEEYSDRISALIHYPCVFSSPESIEGTVRFLEGLKG